MACVGLLLLAAGGSRRLGRPKQLLDCQGQPLLRFVAMTALEAGLGPLTVVLGAEAEACERSLAGLPLRIVKHRRWPDGIGSSLAAGMQAVPAQLAGLIVLLCDQPGIRAADLQALARLGTQAPIVASGYDGNMGPPAYFAAGWFSALANLSGDTGARRLFAREPGLRILPCPRAGWDVDTPADAERLGFFSADS